MKTLFLLFVLTVIAVNASFINPYPRFQRYHDNDDPGEPLYLTPLIKENKLDEARAKAKVVGSDLDSIESYSGYLTVVSRKEYESNMFFWYFPSQTNADNHAPIILWLQGGPGATSLFGLFTENGPFTINEAGKIDHRKYNWNQNHHLIYIDNPVGTGYSFTTSDEGYAKNEKDVAKDLYEAVVQIFTLFPKLQKLDFWITGESYAGKYVPALTFKIHRENKKNETKVPIKLKGMAIGNGFTDPLHQFKYSDYLYQIGLIDLKGKQKFAEYERNGTDYIKKNKMALAFEVFDELIDMDKHPSGSLFKNLTGYSTYYNYLNTKSDGSNDILGKFLQASSTRKSIHVGNNTFHDLSGTENKVEFYLKEDIMKSVALWVAEILGSYRVCIYNGQLDIIVAYPLTLNYLQNLKFDGSKIYVNAPRYIWRVKGEKEEPEIAGYVKEAKNLVEVLIRNAGHMAPADQPKWVLDMITRLTYRKTFA